MTQAQMDLVAARLHNLFNWKTVCEVCRNGYYASTSGLPTWYYGPIVKMLSLEQQDMWCVAITCSGCGYTRLFNAIALGLINMDGTFNA